MYIVSSQKGCMLCLPALHIKDKLEKQTANTPRFKSTSIKKKKKAKAETKVQTIQAPDILQRCFKPM